MNEGIKYILDFDFDDNNQTSRGGGGGDFKAGGLSLYLRNYSNNSNIVTCYVCKEEGHFASACPQKGQGGGGGQRTNQGGNTGGGAGNFKAGGLEF